MPQSSDTFLVDQIIPLNEVHLICGPSGAGKSTLASQLASESRQGGEIFGRACYPFPLCYVACASPLPRLRTIMRAAGIDPASIPHFSLVGKCRPDERTVEFVVSLARELVPDLRVLIIDAFAILCQGKINDHRDVAQFMISAQDTCDRESLTIIGCVGSAKPRDDGQNAAAPRDRIIGATTWSESSGTKIIIDPEKPRDPGNPYRVIHVLPHGLRPETFQFEFKDGALVPRDMFEEGPLDAWLISIAAGTELRTSEIVAAAESMKISRRTCNYWIAKQVEAGTLVRLRQGVFRVAQTGVNPTPLA